MKYPPKNFKALARVSAQATSWQRDWPLAMACPQASSTMLHELSRDTPTLNLKAQGQPFDTWAWERLFPGVKS